MISKTAILGTIIFFYTILTFLMALYGDTLNTEQITDIPTVNFLGDAVIGYASLEWLNVLLFAPLLIVVGWIIVTSLVPTTNSGA